MTLTLPDNLVEYAQRLGDATQRDVAAILADALEMLLPTLENLPEGSSYPTVSSFSDAEVLALANSKMDAVQNQRLGEHEAPPPRDSRWRSFIGYWLIDKLSP